MSAIGSAIGALVGAGASAGGNIGSQYLSSELQYKYAKKMEKNRYTWMREGLQRANLNPILGITKGLSPGGQSINPGGGPIDVMSGVSKGMQGAIQYQQARGAGYVADKAESDAIIANAEAERYKDPTFREVKKTQDAIGNLTPASGIARAGLGLKDLLLETAEKLWGDDGGKRERELERLHGGDPRNAKSIDELFRAQEIPLGAEVGRALPKRRRRKRRGKGRGPTYR